MKTIGDLFDINTRGISYDDILVYIHNIYRYSISNVWSDSGIDITFKEANSYMYEDEYFGTVSMSDIAQVFCQNPNISRNTIIDICQNYNCVNVSRIEFDFNNSIIYLIVE